jgi:hypothetical protein
MIPGKTVGSVSDAACFEHRQSADARIQSCRPDRGDRKLIIRPSVRHAETAVVSATRCK